MITGFNTDVKHREVVFHVQTEDKGRDTASVESLIYVGGRVLARRRVTYQDLLERGEGRDAIASLVERQHRLMIAHIRRGRFDVDVFGDGQAPPTPAPPAVTTGGDRAEVKLAVGRSGAAPAGAQAPSGTAAEPPAEAPEAAVAGATAPAAGDGVEAPPPIDESLTLDQVIFDYLASMASEEHLVLIMDERPELASGRASELEFRTHASRSGQPVAGAEISVRMISTSLPPRRLVAGRTDAEGELRMRLEVPEVAPDTAALIITASSPLGDAEIKYLL